MNPRTWLTPLLAAVLTGCGLAASEPVITENSPASDTAESVEPSSDRHRTGRFTYMADAAMFEDCRNGKRFPVAMEGGYLELERAYLNSGIEPGSPIVVEVEGRYLERPSMEGNHNKVSLIVDTFIALSDEKSCTSSNCSINSEPFYLTSDKRVFLFIYRNRSEDRMSFSSLRI